MAQLNGPIRFTGSVGNVRAYYDKRLKRYILSTKGGANKELILNSPAFVRTRENMSEFGGCSKWAAKIKNSFIALVQLFQGNYFPRIVSVGKNIQKNDMNHDKGSRSIELSRFPKLLEGINFNCYHLFDKVLTHSYSLLFSDDKTTASLALHDFIPYLHLKWPTGIYLFRFGLVAAQVSDYALNRESGDYEPLVLNLPQRMVSAFTEWLPYSTEPTDIHLSASFAEPALSQPGTTVVVAIGIEVLSQSGNPAYLNATGMGTMMIAGCFV
jgi:hypothetical protein